MNSALHGLLGTLLVYPKFLNYNKSMHRCHAMPYQGKTDFQILVDDYTVTKAIDVLSLSAKAHRYFGTVYLVTGPERTVILSPLLIKVRPRTPDSLQKNYCRVIQSD